MQPAPVAVASVTARLIAAGCVAADEEAAELVAAAPDEPTLQRWVSCRERGEPLAWITGTLVFCGRPLKVAPGVYVPRIQTEELAVRASRTLPPHGLAIDFCTGAGAVASQLMAAQPAALVIGVDVDLDAARCARSNGVHTVVGDLDAAFTARNSFDVITAVAPYVPTGDLRLLPADVVRYEPRLALDGGVDGLDLVKRVIAAAGRLLRPGGSLFIELGGDQADALTSDLTAAGLGEIVTWCDDDGDIRGLSAQRP